MEGAPRVAERCPKLSDAVRGLVEVTSFHAAWNCARLSSDTNLKRVETELRRARGARANELGVLGRALVQSAALRVLGCVPRLGLESGRA